MLSAALARPPKDGWSGMVERNLSSAILKTSAVHPLIFLTEAGRRLNNPDPFTPSEASLVFLTAAGPELKHSLTTGVYPFVHCQ